MYQTSLSGIKKGKGVKDHWGNVELLGHLLVVGECSKATTERCRNVKVWAKDAIAYDAGKRKIGRSITLKPAHLGTQITTGLRKYAMHVGRKIQHQKSGNKQWYVLSSRQSFQETDSITMCIFCSEHI
ncbi:hypothetical protein BOTNAR_0178g00110 [Botryotinia narcissicola]|uniref:Uncharacterized protein n=1 Tax=Botryotinia narcissicola TaxID=278944 RepID=A0A4Z1IDD2_9HELO|nr:hypothetical protein BOTNAR_0178g00110 [Botryotinia narcissicola]